MNRRSFLSLLGLGAAAVGVELVTEPVRRYWQVPRNAPVGRPRFTVNMPGVDPSFFDIPAIVDAPDRGAFRFLVSGRAYEGGMVSMRDDATVQACRYDESPIGVVQSVNEDGTAWVRLGRPEVACVEVARVRAEELGYTPAGYESVETRRAREALGGSFDGAPMFGNENRACHQPIGIVESVDVETGLATVRLNPWAVGYRGPGTA